LSFDFAQDEVSALREVEAQLDKATNWAKGNQV
jgi:hypothetical protein